MTEITAAIAKVQLQKLDYLVERTEKIGLELSKYCSEFESLKMPLLENNCRHVFFMWTVKYNDKILGVPRNLIYKDLIKENVPICQGYVRPLYYLPIFYSTNSKFRKRYNKNSYQVTEKLYNNQLLTIQIPGLDIKQKDIKNIYKSFKKVFKKYKKEF